MCSRRCLHALLIGLSISSTLSADDRPPTSAEIRQAITKSLPLLERASAGSSDERTCFTCHNQALPVLALAEARRRVFSIDQENFDRQVRHTIAHLERGRNNYLKGRGQGGKALTAGYALWALEAGEHAGDETTADVANFLLAYQSELKHWSHPGSRPPSSGSDFTTTYVALRGLSVFATNDRRDAAASRAKQVAQWLRQTPAADTEDRVFRLRSLTYIAASEDSISSAVAELIDQQHEDGGWAQTSEMDSDAYATGTVLVALREAGVPATHTAIDAGMRYLVDTQHQDGSWHVATRAKPFQTYFETGFPHDQDQFISVAASSWATWALLLQIGEEVNQSSS